MQNEKGIRLINQIKDGIKIKRGTDYFVVLESQNLT